MRAVAQFELHVVLSAGKPDLADQHVVVFDEIIARGDAQYIRTAFGLSGQHHAPRRKSMTKLLGGVGMRARERRAVEIADFRGDLKSRAIGVQRAEHRDGLVALQYHMRGENRSDAQNPR